MLNYYTIATRSISNRTSVRARKNRETTSFHDATSITIPLALKLPGSRRTRVWSSQVNKIFLSRDRAAVKVRVIYGRRRALRRES